jgi:hypothetical protein
MKMTKKQLIAFDPCPEGLELAKACQFNPVTIWNSCPRGDWLIWLLRKTDQINKPILRRSQSFARAQIFGIFSFKQR